MSPKKIVQFDSDFQITYQYKDIKIQITIYSYIFTFANILLLYYMNL